MHIDAASIPVVTAPVITDNDATTASVVTPTSIRVGQIMTMRRKVTKKGSNGDQQGQKAHSNSVYRRLLHFCRYLHLFCRYLHLFCRYLHLFCRRFHPRRHCACHH